MYIYIYIYKSSIHRRCNHGFSSIFVGLKSPFAAKKSHGHAAKPWLSWLRVPGAPWPSWPEAPQGGPLLAMACHLTQWRERLGEDLELEMGLPQDRWMGYSRRIYVWFMYHENGWELGVARFILETPNYWPIVDQSRPKVAEVFSVDSV